MRVERGDGKAWSAEVGEYLDQVAAAEVVFDVVSRELDQAAAVSRGNHVALGVIYGKPALELDFANFAVDGEFERVGAAAAGVEELHGLMRGKFGRVLRRAEACEVVGAGAGDFGDDGQPPRDETGVAYGTAADGAVDAFAHQIDQAVFAADHDVDVGVPLAKLADTRQDDPGGVGAMHVDAQDAARIGCGVAQRGLGVVQFAQYMHATLVEGLAIRRRADVARAAFEQAGAEPRFQLFYRVGGGGARDVQLIGSAAEAALLDDPREQVERVEVVHGKG